VTLHLDTNTVIRFVKGDARVRDRWQAVRATATLAISSVVLHELEVGLLLSSAASRQREIIGQLIHVDGLLVLDFDARAAREAAVVRAELAQAGAPIGPLDTLIAGHARALGAVMVTNNTKHFARVAGLQLVDWQQP
jgi:tRNA(fMet)-specific endonuclease VapC